MDPRTFYDSLWRVKVQEQSSQAGRRDAFHRWIVDPVFPPGENSRHDVALRLLAGGTRLLDIGCWNGDFLARVRAAHLYSELCGVDLVPASVLAAQAKGFVAQAVDLNGEPLPFEDGRFDAVTILAVLEHVFDPYAIIADIRRVLKPGGVLVIAVPNVASFTNRMRIVFGRIPITSPDPGWDGGHLHYFTKHALDGFLQGAGFEVLQRRASGGRARWREWWISLLSGQLIYLCRRL